VNDTIHVGSNNGMVVYEHHTYLWHKIEDIMVSECFRSWNIRLDGRDLSTYSYNYLYCHPHLFGSSIIITDQECIAKISCFNNLLFLAQYTYPCHSCMHGKCWVTEYYVMPKLWMSLIYGGYSMTWMCTVLYTQNYFKVTENIILFILFSDAKWALLYILLIVSKKLRGKALLKEEAPWNLEHWGMMTWHDVYVYMARLKSLFMWV
jgi:hypothetical protein